MRHSYVVIACALLSACPASDAGSSNNSNATVGCVAGQMVACMCPDGRTLPTMCLPNGQPGACPCFQNAGGGGMHPTGMPAGAGGMSATGMPAGAGGISGMNGMLAGTGGMSATGMLAGTGGMSGMNGMLAGTGGRIGGSGGAMAGSGGKTGGSGGAMAGSGGMGAAGMGGTNDLDMVRQICVDTINMYRATLMLSALTRATPAQETCADMGAKQDADTNTPHGSAGSCPGGLGGQDTCPGWGVGGFSGNATLADALKSCLAQMWAEGPPPGTRQACEADFSGCFQQHGHYLNMSNPMYTTANCGFYEMSSNKWWMNQNF